MCGIRVCVLLHGYRVAMRCRMTNKKEICFKECPVKKKNRDFPGGPVVKNPSSIAGDSGLIPVTGLRSHMLRSN